ncbi:hypothetical protein HanLR1_Chr00c0720g0769211 [Helianthus annuus]|nr:hypothetical protein HanLR1_Chr00c0720g0769211 [Helianthus annuus]
MENSKWLSTVAIIWIQITSGAAYTFGIYSAILKSSQGYDQTTLNTVSVFKDIGGNIGVLAGLTLQCGNLIISFQVWTLAGLLGRSGSVLYRLLFYMVGCDRSH